MKDKCKKCWWNPVCKKTNKACHIIQGIDARWDDSPNIHNLNQR